MMKKRLFLITLILCAFQTMHAAGKKDPSNWTDGGSTFYANAYDDSWYTNSETEFTLKSNNQLGGFAKKVNTDKISFEGKTVHLGADVDMSVYNWVPINGFKGTFDGNGHTISFLKTDTTATGYALFANLDGGEVKNVIASGEVKGKTLVGGLVGILSNGGKITNSAYTGKVESTQAGAYLGGIVGKNEGGMVENCFFNGEIALVAGTIAGNIAGYSNDGIFQCFYLENDTLAEAAGEGSTEGASAMPFASFATGELAWHLNNLGDVHTGSWSQGDSVPILADEKHNPIYAISYPTAEEGNILGKEYAKAGETVYLSATPSEGKICVELEATNAEITAHSFVMPANDVQVSCRFIAQPTLTTTQEIENFVTVKGEPVSQPLSLEGSTFEDPESLAYTLSNPSVFSIEEEEGTFKLTYTPSNVGKDTATLTFSSLYAEDLVLELTGLCAPEAPRATEATEIQTTGFTAHWVGTMHTQDYLLSVMNSEGEVIDTYDALPVGKVTSFEVTNLTPGQYSYVVQGKNGEAISNASNPIEVTTLAGAALTYSPLKSFAAQVNSEDTQTLTLTGNDITGEVSLALSGSPFFGIDKSAVNLGEEVVITYQPTAAGVHTASITLTANGVETTTLSLTGENLPERITLLPEETITSTSFVAKWNNINDATSYLITVKQGENLVNGYPAKSTEGNTSVTVKGLSPATEYTYSVQALKGALVSEASEAATVTTTVWAPVASSIEKYSFKVNWEGVDNATKYLVTLSQGGNILASYHAIPTSENSFVFTGLAPQTTYQCKVVLNGENADAAETIEVTTADDYGTQLNNSGFELWEDINYNSKKSREPVDWNSFMSVGGGLADNAAKEHMAISSEVRPGSFGLYSTRIWTSQIMSVNANGNLTCGRIIAGSPIATNLGNHNISLSDDPEFSEALDGATPDSLTVWVKFKPVNINDSARIAATIHDTYDYRDPSEGDPEASNHVVAKAELDYLATPNREWQRITIPFDYSGPAESADYMLVTFTTQRTPGKGSIQDMVYIDDLLLVYTPELGVSDLAKSAYRNHETIEVPYTLSGTMSPSNLNATANTVSLELSDATGSFDAPTTLTTVCTDYSGTLVAQIPEGIEGTYKLRVVTTNYPMVSAPFEIEIKAIPVLSASATEAFHTTPGVRTQQALTVGGTNLEADVIATLESDFFKLDNYSLSPAGGNLEITYQSESAGIHTATLVLTSSTAEAVSIPLVGNTSPNAVQALDATEIDDRSFTATWEASSDAIDYLLTVTQDGEALEGYKDLSTDVVTSYVVTGLTAMTEYSYTVKVVTDYFLSATSNVILAETIQGVGIESTTSATFSVHSDAATHVLFIDGIDDGFEYRIYTIAGVAVKADVSYAKSIDVTTLTPGVYFIEIAGSKVKFIKR